MEAHRDSRRRGSTSSYSWLEAAAISGFFFSSLGAVVVEFVPECRWNSAAEPFACLADSVAACRDGGESE